MPKSTTTGRTAARTTTPKQEAAKVAKPKAEKKLNECRCGCGRQVKGAFAQGHDARTYGMVLRGELPESVIADQAGLMSKLAFARKQADAKAARKAKADATPKPTTPEAEAQPEAEPTPEVSARQARKGRKPSRVSG